MRMVVAVCSAVYAGRLRAELPVATRLLLLKADGSIAIHSDDRAYKPLNWMTPPVSCQETPEKLVFTNKQGEVLTIELHEVVSDTSAELGSEPGLVKDGVEAQLQVLLAAHPEAIEPGLRLVQREYPTGIGPVDLLCRDSEWTSVVVEIKRLGEIQGVEQLSRYMERLSQDPSLGRIRPFLVAQRFKPQAKVLAESRGIACVAVDYDALQGLESDHLVLF